MSKKVKIVKEKYGNAYAIVGIIHIGVYYSNTSNRWVACLYENNKSHTKYCKTIDEAINERILMEEKYQKEFSYNNSIKEDNNA